MKTSNWRDYSNFSYSMSWRWRLLPTNLRKMKQQSLSIPLNSLPSSTYFFIVTNKPLRLYWFVMFVSYPSKARPWPKICFNISAYYFAMLLWSRVICKSSFLSFPDFYFRLLSLSFASLRARSSSQELRVFSKYARVLLKISRKIGVVLLACSAYGSGLFMIWKKRVSMSWAFQGRWSNNISKMMIPSDQTSHL